MNITVIGACDDFHMASIRWDEPKGGIDEMVMIILFMKKNCIRKRSGGTCKKRSN